MYIKHSACWHLKYILIQLLSGKVFNAGPLNGLQYFFSLQYDEFYFILAAYLFLLSLLFLYRIVKCFLDEGVRWYELEVGVNVKTSGSINDHQMAPSVKIVTNTVS